MKSIFDLKTKNSELSSANQGLSNYRYQEIQALRSVLDNKFADGEIIYRWTYGSNKYWIPNKSYLRVRVALTGPNGRRITSQDNLTYAMNTVPQLFQACSYKISDMTVCTLTQNLTAVDSLKKRMYHSGGWLNTIGQSTNNWSSQYQDREKNLVSYGGNLTNELVTYKTFTQFADTIPNGGTGLINTDTVEIVNNAAGETVITFTNATPLAHEVDILNTGVKKGDVIIYELPVTTLTNAYRQKSSGVITSIVVNPGANTTTISILPQNGVEVLASNQIGNTDISISLHRHDIYDEEHGDFAGEIDLIWYPPLSVFDLQQAIPCASTKHELTLTPYADSTYQKHIIESRGENKVLGTDFNIEIKDMRFYILTCDSNKIQDNFDFMLDLNTEVQCQSTPITSTSQQQTIDVKPSTNMVTIALRDKDTLNDTRYPSSKFKIRDDLELNLNRYYIRYEIQVPQPDGEFQLVTIGNGNATGTDIGQRDLFRDAYNRTKIYDGTIFTDSPETIEEWRNRGMYITHPFPKTNSSRNTRLYVRVEFSSLTDSTGTEQEPFLLVFSHYTKVVVLKVQNGRIVNVSPYDT